jgi:surface antigen
MATSIAGPRQLLADVQVTAIGAGQTIHTVSGQTFTQGTSTTQMTPNSVNSTQPFNKTVWHALYLAVHPGTLAAGQAAPDLVMWVRVDGQDFSQWFYVDLSVGGCMFPRRQNTVGGKVILLGESMMEWAARIARGAQRPKNMPMRFTGWKIVDGIDFYFYSAAGFGAATFLEPPTIQLYGDVYDEAAAAWVNAVLGWDGEIRLQSERRARAGKPEYRSFHDAPGISVANWKRLPDGANQGGTKVHRTFKFATNNVAVAGTSITPLSKIGSLQGKVGNVPVDQQDLGWDYSGKNNAFQLIEVGRRPGAGAGYFGLYFGGTEIYPPETAYGLVCTPGNPRVYFGQVQPIREEGALYFPVQKWGQWSPGEAEPELIAGETAALAIAAQNGQTIAVGTDETAVGGVTVLAAQ